MQSVIYSLVQCFTPWGEQYHLTIDMSAECSNASCTEVTGLSESLVRKAAESMQVLLYPPHGGHYSCHHDTVALLQCGHFSLHLLKKRVVAINGLRVCDCRRCHLTQDPPKLLAFMANCSGPNQQNWRSW